MKKITRLLIALPILCLMLSGCASSSQSLAKNLDTTVTNLVYTVSSLDWADNELIKSFSSPTIDNLTAVQQIPNNNNTLITSVPETAQINNTQNGACVPCPHYHPEELIQNQTGEQQMQAYSMPYTYNYDYNMSGNRYPRQRLSRNKISKINATQNSNYQTYSISNFADNIVYANSETMKNLTETIEEKSTQVVDRLSTLIEKRANTLLYVNALYSKKIFLNKEAVTAINAYINIIKDNTSYLDSNKGLIANQLSHAGEIKATSQYSPLINAYIIRTSEAIDTRLAKLDSSIEAINAIIEILDANMTGENIPNTINQNNTKINNKISKENKIANISENNSNNCNNECINEEILQKTTENENNISSQNVDITQENPISNINSQSNSQDKINNKITKNEDETQENPCENCKNNENIDFLDNNYRENTKTNKLVPPKKPTILENSNANIISETPIKQEENNNDEINITPELNSDEKQEQEKNINIEENKTTINDAEGSK